MKEEEEKKLSCSRMGGESRSQRRLLDFRNPFRLKGRDKTISTGRYQVWLHNEAKASCKEGVTIKMARQKEKVLIKILFFSAFVMTSIVLL